MKTSEDFIKGLVVAVQQGAAKGMIKNLKAPTGRRIPPVRVKIADCLNGLDSDGLEMIESIAAEGINNGIFGVLSVIDGVRAVEDHGPKGNFKIVYESTSGECTVLNSDASEFLHDIYRGIVPPLGH